MNFSRLSIFNRSDVSAIKKASTNLEKDLIYNKLCGDYQKIERIHPSQLFENITTDTFDIRTLTPYKIFSKVAEDKYQQYLEEKLGSLTEHVDPNVHSTYMRIIEKHIEEGDFNNLLENPFEGSQHISFKWASSIDKDNEVLTPRLNTVIDELDEAIRNFYTKDNREDLLQKIALLHEEILSIQQEAQINIRQSIDKTVIESVDMRPYFEKALEQDTNAESLSKLQVALEKAIEEDKEVQKLKQLLEKANLLFDSYYHREIHEYDTYPEEDMIMEVAGELLGGDFSASANSIAIEQVQTMVSDSIYSCVEENVYAEGLDVKDIDFQDGYHGQQFLVPQIKLFSDEESPSMYSIRINSDIVEELIEEDSSAVLDMIRRLENDGLDALYFYYQYNDGIEFFIGEEVYGEASDAIRYVEAWIKCMEAIALYLQYWEERTSESAMVDAVRTNLETLLV